MMSDEKSPVAVHRIEGGASVLESVATLAQAIGAPELWLRAIGEVREARLSSGAKAGDPVVGSVDSAALLASCDIHVQKVGGRFEVRAYAVVGFDAGGVWSTRAGRLTHAIADDVMITLVAGAGGTTSIAVPAAPTPEPVRVAPVAAAPSRSDSLNSGPDRPRASLMPERAAQTLDSRPAPPRDARPAPLKTSPSPSTAWDQLAAFSAQMDDDEDDDVDVDDLKPNDRIMHPSLGELRVLRVTPEGSVNVELKNKATRKLKMTPFLMTRTDDGKYQLRLKNA
jgi:hypothetical protein